MHLKAESASAFIVMFIDDEYVWLDGVSIYVGVVCGEVIGVELEFTMALIGSSDSVSFF
jgi:hypothetical protein